MRGCQALRAASGVVGRLGRYAQPVQPWRCRKVLVAWVEVGEGGDGWCLGLEDGPVDEVVAVLGQVADPVPSSNAFGGGVVEDMPGDLLRECSWEGEPDGGGVELGDAVVHDPTRQVTSQLGEGLVVPKFDVVAVYVADPMQRPSIHSAGTAGFPRHRRWERRTWIPAVTRATTRLPRPANELAEDHPAGATVLRHL